MKRTIKNQNTYKLLKKHQEQNTQPSQTIPTEQLGIRDLIKKYKRGEILDVEEKVPMYEENATHDSLDFQKFQRMDKVEQNEVYTEQLIKLAKMQESIKTKIKQSEKAADEATKEAEEAAKPKKDTPVSNNTQNTLKTNKSDPPPVEN